MTFMGRKRGYILVLLVAIWATMPALASLCPREVPPCCRGMREMCCMHGSGSALKVCCQMHMPGPFASPAAVVNSTDHAWQEVAQATPAGAPALELPSSTREPAAIAASPPLLLSHSYSILRI